MKLKESKTVEVSRSSIKEASYNPRKKSDEVVRSLIKNFKSVGYLGGVLYNKRTGTLISGHKRVEALDRMHKYTGKNDYTLKVEEIDVDEKTEMEQNIYMNNIEQQGEYDYEKLAFIVPKIDFSTAGLTEFQLEKTAVFAPPPPIQPDKEDDKPKEKEELSEVEKLERKEKVKEAKQKAQDQAQTSHENATNSHITIVFDTWDEKVEFCESFGLDIEGKFVSGSEFIEKME